MKKIVTLACSLIYLFGANAQKHDYHWVTGWLPNNFITKDGGSLLNFNTNPVEVSAFRLPMGNVSCTMSDKNGQLAFYTSGCFLANRNHQTILNSDKMNWLPNENNKWWNYCLDTTFISYSTTLNSVPGMKDGQYYVFSTFATDYVLNTNFLYQLVDMNLDNGNGMVIEKNKIILQDSFPQAQEPAITKHGNGRDWWLVLPRSTLDTTIKDSLYFIFLLDPTGIHLHHTQKIGYPFSMWSAGSNSFSPDGTKFIRYNPWNGLFLFDFDRCSGYFSKPKSVFLPHSPSKTPWVDGRDTGFVQGAAIFSPNSERLYVSTGPILYQFDISQNDINSTRKVIHAYDTIPIYSKMAGNVGCIDMTLAPDGQIYLSTFDFVNNHYHVIEKPDEIGAACHFRFNGLELPNNRAMVLPHSPNYRLGALKDSPCDTIRVATQELDATAYQLSISPNPATDRLTIEVTLPHYDEKTELVLCDLIGKELIKTTLPDYAYIGYMDVGQLSAGMYILQLRQRSRILKSEKVVVE